MIYERTNIVFCAKLLKNIVCSCGRKWHPDEDCDGKKEDVIKVSPS